MTQDEQWKQALTNDFVIGASVSDLASHCGVPRRRVEDVLREALRGLAVQVARLARADQPAEQEQGNGQPH